MELGVHAGEWSALPCGSASPPAERDYPLAKRSNNTHTLGVSCPDSCLMSSRTTRCHQAKPTSSDPVGEGACHQTKCPVPPGAPCLLFLRPSSIEPLILVSAPPVTPRRSPAGRTSCVERSRPLRFPRAGCSYCVLFCHSFREGIDRTTFDEAFGTGDNAALWRWRRMPRGMAQLCLVEGSPDQPEAPGVFPCREPTPGPCPAAGRTSQKPQKP
jgi:hypothetical protein